MMRIAIIPLVLLVLTAVCIYAIQRGAETPADFTFIPDGSITTLDPHDMSWAQDISLAQSLWEGLYGIEPGTRRPIPAAASSVDISEDGYTYIFHLRPEARWTNGDAVVAGDFLFAWRRMLEVPAEYSALFYCIRGAEAYQSAINAGEPADWSTVGISSPDDYTVIVELRAPTPYFLSLLAMPAFFPLHEASMQPFARKDSAHGWTTYDERFTQPPHLVTNGPYRLALWEFRRRIRLVKSEHYWNADTVALNIVDQVDVEDPLAMFQAYHTGMADFVMTVSPELRYPLREKGRTDLTLFNGFGTYFYSINCQPTLNDGSPNPLADVRVRQALAMTMDRQAVVDTVTRSGESPAQRYIPPGIFAGYESPAGPGRDVDRARALLAEAGYPQGRGFPRISIIYNTGSNHGDIAQIVRRQWQQVLGIDVELEGMETSTFRTRLRSKNYTIARASWLGDYNDPSTFTDKYHSQAEGNDAGWANADYDRLLGEAAVEADPVRRLALLSEAEHILNDQLPVIPVYYYVHAYLIRPWVKGIPSDPQRMLPLKLMRIERE